MFIPLRTNRPPRRKPVVTEALVVLNLAVYLLGAAGSYLGLFDGPETLANFGHFDPRDFKAWQLVSYQFLHDPHGIWHIAFNMLFLWVFGCAVEDRLGRLGYPAFYLLGGAVAGLAQMVFDPLSPVIGASGSIAGVTGAFLALFPRSRIQVLLFFFIVGVFSVPSLWFIGFYFVIDVLRQTGNWLGGGGSHVAYMAHIAGYLYGFGVGFGLLATGTLKREEFDVFFLFTQSRRRKAFRAASGHGPAGMWESAQADTTQRLARQPARPLSEKETRRVELRADVNRLIASGDLPAAAKSYQRLLADARGAPVAVLVEQHQLDIASQLYAQGAHADAASAYELLLASYPSSAKTNEVRLILGLIYARQLNRPQRARELIEQARQNLRDRNQTVLADQLLAELGA
ncbi:MAG: rhomboid family intramembrane serine protease [Planctomycetota bacterium]|jgi:membrane associated rhomboid family serine protease